MSALYGPLFVLGVWRVLIINTLVGWLVALPHSKNFFLNTPCHIKVMSHDYDVTLRGVKGWDCFDSGRQIVVYYADITLRGGDVSVA